MEYFTVNFVFVLQIFFGLGRVYGLTITNLNVPVLVDPRDSLGLGCVYDMGGEELYSVKWYKDEAEFFRYTPRQQPHVMAFPVAGVHLVPHTQPCNASQCAVHLTRLTTTHSGGAYKCEVSTEAPKFRVGFRSSNVTVAAVGRAAPTVHGLLPHYALADLVHVNCTASPADPAPTLHFLVNGERVDVGVGLQRTLATHNDGLVSVTRDLRFHAERRHFPPPHHVLRLACQAQPPPTVPAPPLTSPPSTARLLPPPSPQQRNVLANEKLEWFNGKASKQSGQQGLMFAVVFVTICWRFL